MKTCIVAGNAACLHEDLEKAKKYGDLPIIAVNGAAREVRAFALFSQHPEHFLSHGWIRRQKRIHDEFTVNSCGEGDLPYVDHWWPIDRTGGSAWGARKLACLLGFDRVILLGCPLEPGPYAGNHNLGGFMHKNNVVKDLQDQIEKDTDWHEGVISLSGWTREMFGC